MIEMEYQMARLLIEHATLLVTMKDTDTVINAQEMVVLPGLATCITTSHPFA